LLAFIAESVRSDHACPFLCIWLNDVLPRHRGKLAFQTLSAVKFYQVVRSAADFTISLTAFPVLKADSWLTLPENMEGGGAGGGGGGAGGKKGNLFTSVSFYLTLRIGETWIYAWRLSILIDYWQAGNECDEEKS